MKQRRTEANQATLFEVGQPPLPLWKQSEDEQAAAIYADYEAARRAHDKAQAEYMQHQLAYRAGEIETEEYLAARRAYDAATVEFDRAYAKAAGWQN